MLYEKLNYEMRRTVDEYAVQLEPMAWTRRRAVLATLAMPFVEDLGRDAARLAAQGFLTALLERWDDGAVVDPRQASLYADSLNPIHRAMAAEYWRTHPHLRESAEAILPARRDPDLRDLSADELGEPC